MATTDETMDIVQQLRAAADTRSARPETSPLLLVLRTAADHVEALHAAIRAHRDARGDDRCWMDDAELYNVQQGRFEFLDAPLW